MALILLEGANSENKMVVEFFGLPKSGKSTILREIDRKYSGKGIEVMLSKGYYVSSVKGEGLFDKIKLFFRAFVKKPLNIIKLFFILNKNWISVKDMIVKDYVKIFFIRNSYLMAVFSRQEKALKLNKIVFADELLMQSIFMIMQRKSNERELKEIIELLDLRNNIVIIEIDEKERERRSQKSLREGPVRKLNMNYFKEWRKNQYYNYKIIKKIILDKG